MSFKTFDRKTDVEKMLKNAGIEITDELKEKIDIEKEKVSEMKSPYRQFLEDCACGDEDEEDCGCGTTPCSCDDEDEDPMETFEHIETSMKTAKYVLSRPAEFFEGIMIESTGVNQKIEKFNYDRVKVMVESNGSIKLKFINASIVSNSSGAVLEENLSDVTLKCDGSSVNGDW